MFFVVHYNSVKVRGGEGISGTTPSRTRASPRSNIIEEITKPITLTFRLFGNIFAGVLMVR